jgi:hypothetical protein
MKSANSISNSANRQEALLNAHRSERHYGERGYNNQYGHYPVIFYHAVSLILS